MRRVLVWLKSIEAWAWGLPRFPSALLTAAFHGAHTLVWTFAFGYVGFWMAFGFYVIKEAETLYRRLAKGRPLDPWYDHLSDVLVPWLVGVVAEPQVRELFLGWVGRA